MKGTGGTFLTMFSDSRRSSKNLSSELDRSGPEPEDPLDSSRAGSGLSWWILLQFQLSQIFSCTSCCSSLGGAVVWKESRSGSGEADRPSAFTLKWTGVVVGVVHAASGPKPWSEPSKQRTEFSLGLILPDGERRFLCSFSYPENEDGSQLQHLQHHHLLQLQHPTISCSMRIPTPDAGAVLPESCREAGALNSSKPVLRGASSQMCRWARRWPGARRSLSGQIGCCNHKQKHGEVASLAAPPAGWSDGSIKRRSHQRR
ncbi:hypothetical protein OJAV_G00234450 [Oryzias javanicus]|uniref:Uncharacterized protein n=1 Tax=Oryzias javanicus TaxID=123683 RepID=A0A437BZH0_ORYJA|nr:hypothetical protein OJAV_G00234450 [Oryzias javanicus]